MAVVKLVALYKRPEDPATFDRRYFEEHLPLAQKMPGLRRVEVARVTGEIASDLYLIAELYFDDLDAARAAMASPESKAAAKVLMEFARGLVSFHVAEVI